MSELEDRIKASIAEGERHIASGAPLVPLDEALAMTAPDLSDYERATVERIDAAEAAPESFDAMAALRRVLEAADEIHRRGAAEVAAMDDEPDEHRKNQCASRASTYARAEHLIRTALAGPT